jgi:hypothetical protein
MHSDSADDCGSAWRDVRGVSRDANECERGVAGCEVCGRVLEKGRRGAASESLAEYGGAWGAEGLKRPGCEGPKKGEVCRRVKGTSVGCGKSTGRVAWVEGALHVESPKSIGLIRARSGGGTT